MSRATTGELASSEVRLAESGASANVPLIAVALTGGVAWSGVHGALVLALLAPVLILSARTRGVVASRAFCYFAAATWPIVPAAAVFFGPGGPDVNSMTRAVLGWLAVASANTLPWMLVSPRAAAGRVTSLLLGLLLPAVPPLAFLGLASPLTGVGLLLPGSGVWGMIAVVVVGAVWIATRACTRMAAVAALGVLTLTAHALSLSHSRGDGEWLAVSTAVGAHPQSAGVMAVDAEAIERLRGLIASTSATVLVLPEAHFRDWTAASDAFLAPLWRRLAREGRSVVLGVNRRNLATGYLDNAVLVRGASHGELLQHYPVPVSMYRAGASGSTPMHLRGSYSLDVGNEQVGVVICWEQLLLAPMLQLAIESPRPDRLVAVSNLYFARGTPVARIQQASVAAWARLFGVPYVHAMNE